VSIKEVIGWPLYQLALPGGLEWAYSVDQMRIAQRDAEELEVRLSRATELLKLAHSALDECMEGQVVFDIDAFLSEQPHE
jgi:hypothetical protein